MKKLQIVAPGRPSKHGKGYQVLLYYRMLQFCKNFEVELLTFTKWNFKLFTHTQTQRHQNYLYTEISLGIFELVYNLLIAVIKNYPLLTVFATSSYVKNALRRDSDVLLICYLSRCFLNFANISRNRLVVEFVDSMALNFARRQDDANILKKLVYRREESSNAIFEQRISKKVKLSTTVSGLDARFISERVEVHRLGVLVNNLDARSTTDSICFSGNMNYAPNIQAVLWFYNNVWKCKPSKFANFKFRVIGANPTSEILRLAVEDNSLEVTGFVESVREEISKSKISVAPMQSGSGMQFKILEAMALGLPVVATKLALGDIRAIDRQHLLLAEDHLEYWRAIECLISDTSFYANLSYQSYQFVLKNHSWNDLNMCLINDINKVMRSKS